MFYINVTGKSAAKGDYSHTKPTNLELALEDRADMVYSAKAQEYGNIRSWFIDESNGKGWESMDTEVDTD